MTWKGLIGRLFPGLASRDGDQPRENIKQLQQWQQNRQFLQVTFPEYADTAYQSLILHVDDQQRLITIDELYPKADNLSVQVGDTVDISHQKLQGRRLCFSSKIKAISKEDERIVYKLTLPKAINEVQQRHAYRVQIPQNSRLKLYVETDQRILCSLRNLSSIGIGFVVPGNVSEWIRAHHKFELCTLDLGESGAIACDIAVRSYTFETEPHRHTVVGGQLLNIPPADQRKLDQFIWSLQKEQRQQEIVKH